MEQVIQEVVQVLMFWYRRPEEVELHAVSVVASAAIVRRRSMSMVVLVRMEGAVTPRGAGVLPVVVVDPAHPAGVLQEFHQAVEGVVPVLMALRGAMVHPAGSLSGGEGMKRTSESLGAGPLYVVITLLISIFPAELSSQNNAVRWSTLDVGFATSVSSNSVVRSAIGQGFVGTIQQGDTHIESGFLADIFIRRTMTSAVKEPWAPSTYLLEQNFPNPFNPSTRIEFSLPFGQFVSLKVFDVLGRSVAVLHEGWMEAGTKATEWNADGMPSGVYVYRLQTETYADSRMMTLVR